MVQKVEAIANLHGHEYDAIKKTVKDGELIVAGEKTVDNRAEGLGGTFTYCTLGAPVELDKVLSGEALPSFDVIWLRPIPHGNSTGLRPVHYAAGRLLSWSD